MQVSEFGCYVPIRALGHVQHPRRVSGELRYLRHARVLPQTQLVLAVAM
jgi:hypothetical protein